MDLQHRVIKSDNWWDSIPLSNQRSRGAASAIQANVASVGSPQAKVPTKPSPPTPVSSPDADLPAWADVHPRPFIARIELLCNDGERYAFDYVDLKIKVALRHFR